MQHFIFDLDGTITHPQPGIVGGYRYAFDKLGFPDKEDDELIPLIGPPLKYVFSKMYHFSDTDTELAIKFYREYYYDQGGMYDAIIFAGMKDLFISLKEKKKTLHVATNKGLHADKILDHFDVLEFFTHVEYYNEEKNILTKEKMIENILEFENIQDKNAVIMIGDREHDLRAAKNVGIHAVGVLFGFGGREELEKCQPDAIVADVTELSAVLHQYL